MIDLDKKLSELWADPSIGLSSSRKFYLKVKELHPDWKVTQKVIDEFLTKQEARQINYKKKKTKGYHNIIAHFPGNNYFADLADMQKYRSANHGYRFILVIIDVYSRYSWLIPLKTKTEKDMGEAFTEFFEKNKVCKDLSTDAGPEFLNGSVQAILKKYKINHFVADVGDHHRQGLVERMIGSVRIMLNKYWAAYDTFNWVDILKDIEKNYNTTEHSSIKTTPYKAFHMKAAPYRAPQSKVEEFKIGQIVRKRIEHHILEKKVARWSAGIYTITGMSGRRFLLDDLKTPVKGEDLQLIKGPISKVEKTKKISNAAVTKKAISQQKIAAELKALDIDQSKVLNTPREKKKNSKYNDYV